MEQQAPKRKKFAASPKKHSATTNRKTQIVAPTTPAKAKGNPPVKSNQTTVNSQKASKVTKAKIKQEPDTGVKAEKALAGAQELLTTPVRRDEQTHIRRTSFIVRLMIGKDNQLGRTEIEHVPSGRRQSFLTPEGERLVTFMEACVRTTISSELSIPVAPMAKPMDHALESRDPRLRLVILDVRVFQLENPKLMTLTLSHTETIGIEICFQLQGSDPQFLTTHAPTFKINLYTHEMTSGKSKLLTTCEAKLIREVREYIVPLRPPVLPVGLYRLFTVITLDAPYRIGGFQSGTMIRVR